LRRFHAGESIEQIAGARGFVPSTIYSHLLAAIECDRLPDARERFFTPAQEKEIVAAFRQTPDGKLVDDSAPLGGRYDIGLLRIFRALNGRKDGFLLARGRSVPTCCKKANWSERKLRLLLLLQFS
jgi:hypothetical protein